MDNITIIQSSAFILGTIILVLISKRSLRNYKYHGFYRFFVFEFTLSLIILNIPHWLENPFSFQQIISWFLLSSSILLIVESIYFFKKYGGNENRKDYPANFKIENTVTLINKGIYKYIRHPMYSSLLFLAFGAMLKFISLLTVLLALIILIFIIFTGKIEERENIQFFGTEYEKYMKNTKIFIPLIL